MVRTFALFFLVLCGACASMAPQSINAGFPATQTPATQTAPQWTPIALSDVTAPDVRQTLADLLRLVDVDALWPGFAIDGPPLVIVDGGSRNFAYCVGHCEPSNRTAGGTSRLWCATTSQSITPGEYRFVSMREWGLGEEGQLVATAFSNREQTVATALHEYFHLRYQSAYSTAHGDEIEASAPPSGARRDDLTNHYAYEVTNELREECVALTAALHGPAEARMIALEHFVAIRDRRRARHGTPALEEDFWERQEGVPTNLERRAAAYLGFNDPSVIRVLNDDRTCSVIPKTSYFLILGALEGAVLDTIGDSQWPHRVYPTDGSKAVSLYTIIRALVINGSER